MLKSKIPKAIKTIRRTLWALLVLTPIVVLAAPVTSSQVLNNAQGASSQLGALVNNAPEGASSQLGALTNNAPEGASSPLGALAANVPEGAGSQLRALADNVPEGVGSQLRALANDAPEGAGSQLKALAGDAAAKAGIQLPFGQNAGVPDILTMLQTLDKSLLPLTTMVTALAYMFGIGLMLSAIWELRKYGEGISMVSQRDIRPILMRLCAGTALIFIPTTVKTLLITVYGNDSILGYEQWPATAWEWASKSLIIFVGFIGLVAIVRGILHLHKAAGGQSQQNGFTKGIIHLIGGVCSMNIVAMKDILYSTLGLTT